MNTTPGENREEHSNPQESINDSNVLDGSSVRCFPAVKRSFRQKQCNWRWRWKYFTRALQPISEQGESTKDDSNKADDNGNLPAEDGIDHEKNLSSLESATRENIENSNQGQPSQCSNTPQSENTIVKDEAPVKSKEDYSACIKLIEKFQEAVLDNAVRIIQAAFKRFRERRRFLKLRKAATVIQRSVRRWLDLRYSCLRPELPSDDCDSEHGNEVHKAGLSRDVKAKCSVTKCIENDYEAEVISSEDSASDDCASERSKEFDEMIDSIDSNCNVESQIPRETSDSASEESKCTVTVEQFDDSLDCMDATWLSGSSEDVNQMETCSDSEETSDLGNKSPITEPDALSLADSGIDMSSDTAVETITEDDCECLSVENDIKNYSDQATEIAQVS